MEFKINFFFIICIIIAVMFIFSVVLAVRDSLKQIKQEKAKEKEELEFDKVEKYNAYALLDYDDERSIYLLEIYDFRDGFFDIKEFETFSDLVNFYTDELCELLHVKDSDILQVISKSYQKQAINGFTFCIFFLLFLSYYLN